MHASAASIIKIPIPEQMIPPLPKKNHIRKNKHETNSGSILIPNWSDSYGIVVFLSAPPWNGCKRMFIARIRSFHKTLARSSGLTRKFSRTPLGSVTHLQTFMPHRIHIFGAYDRQMRTMRAGKR